MTPPELVHIAMMQARIGDDQFLIPNGPMGSRLIAEVIDVVIEGERLNARMVGKSCADWATVGPDGSYAALDVRVTLKTDDDVILYCEYGGRLDFASSRAVTSPLFQCGDEKYDWLNRIQVIGDGIYDESTQILTYQLYEVRPMQATA